MEKICLRCGVEEKDKDEHGCKAWGTYYDEHLFGEDERKQEVTKKEKKNVDKARRT